MKLSEKIRTAEMIDMNRVADEVVRLEATNTELLEALEGILGYAENSALGTTEGQPKLIKAYKAIRKAKERVINIVPYAMTAKEIGERYLEGLEGDDR